MRTGEQQAGDDRSDQARKQHRTASEPIGKLVRDEQREEQTDNVGGENRCQRGGRETDLGLPANIERCRRIGEDEHGGDDPRRCQHAPRDAMAAGLEPNNTLVTDHLANGLA